MYNMMNKYFVRLTNLKELCCNEFQTDQQRLGLQEFLSKDQQCPYVTDLYLTLNDDTLEPENLDEQRIHPLFRFYLLPSLRGLTISVFPRENFIVLDPSISQGLKTLVHLKNLTLLFADQVQGRRFLLEGLPYLPLLDQFDLSINDITNDEELLLVEFFQKQAHLVSLKLRLEGPIKSRQRYEEHNLCLEMICQSLNYKPELKYLTLEAPTTWSLQALSKGLSLVGITNQLREFRIECFDDLLSPLSTPQDKLKDLCAFIIKQKQSLSCLEIYLEFMKEDQVIEILVKTICGIDKLEEFCLGVNRSFEPLKENKLLQHIPEESLKGYPSYETTFAFLKDTLPRLKELFTLRIHLNPLILPYDVPMIDSSVIFDALPALKNLDYLSLRLPFISQSLKAYPVRALKLCQIKNLMVDCSILAVGDGSRIEEVEEALLHTRQERWKRYLLRF